MKLIYASSNPNPVPTPTPTKVKLIYASSSSVYGANTKTPFSEADRVDSPNSLYAASKKANEAIAHVYHGLYQIPVLDPNPNPNTNTNPLPERY